MGDRSSSQLMRSKSKTFYLASHFLPSRVRNDVRDLYVYYRTLDDLADSPISWDSIRQIEVIEKALAEGGSGSLIAQRALSVAKRYRIPITVLEEVLRGIRIDLNDPHFETYEDVYRYANLVAGSVGAALCHVLGDVTEQSVWAARQLGIAMQLTNILRDIGEDLRAGRIYLPADDLDRFHVDVKNLRRGTVDEPFARLMKFEISRAQDLYDQGLSGLNHLYPRCRFAVAAAATLYAGILTEIEERNFDVFHSRVALSHRQRWLCLPAAWKASRRPRPPCPGDKVTTNPHASGPWA